MNYTPSPAPAGKLGKFLGLSWLLAAACFLFDPYISIVDLLPDAVGYLLFLPALYRLADLDERLADAAKGVRYLLLIGIARLLALLLAFGFMSPAEQPVFILLALFTLGVLNCIVLIPMWKNLCGGLLYLGSRNDATAMFDRRGFRGKTRTRNVVERYTAFSAVFFFLREVLAVLPELSVLTSEQGGVEMDSATGYYDFVGLFRLAGSVISFVLGVVWLVMTVQMIRKLKSDTPFFARLTEKYRSEVLSCHDLFARRAVKGSLLCLIVAAVLSIDLYLDGVNVLPDVLPALFLLLSVTTLRRYAGKNVPALITAGGYALVSTLFWLLQVTDYFRRDDVLNVHRRGEIYSRWQTTVLLQAVAAILFLLAVFCILHSLYRMVQCYTGVRSFHGDLPYDTERTDSIHSLIRKKLILCGVLAVLTALSSLFFWGVIPLMPEMDLTLSGGSAQTQNVVDTLVTTAYQILTEGYWFVDILIGVIWIFTLSSATGEISEQMEYSSMMQD